MPDFRRLRADQITPPRLLRPPLVPPHTSICNSHSDYKLSGSSEMSMMVTALTNVVCSEPQNDYKRGGGIASCSANQIQTSINSHSSASSISSRSVGRERRHHHEDYATEFFDNGQRVYYRFGDSLSAVKLGGMQTEQPASVSKKTEKGKRKIGFRPSLEDLEPHFGKKLKDVVKELGVGRSTIKRACRNHGIGRWPCNEKQTRNPSLYEKEMDQDSQQEAQPSAIIVQEEAEKVMTIKVRSDEDIIKFDLCLSLGAGKLFEEVATRLKLKMGTFKLKYLDEDKDEILVTCDADLQLCPKSRTVMGRSCIQLFVLSVSK